MKQVGFLILFALLFAQAVYDRAERRRDQALWLRDRNERRVVDWLLASQVGIPR